MGVREMKVDTVVKKVLIAKAFLMCLALGFWSETSLAWTVSDNVVEMPSQNAVVGSNNTTASTTVPLNLDKSIVEEKGKEAGEPVIIKKIRNQEPEQSGRAVFEKTPSALNSEEQASSDYNNALRQFDTGDTFQAERVLINALNSKPDHHASRKELATLYLKREQLVEAEHVLQEGLKLDENNAEFLKLMAVIHDRRSEPEKALSLLVKVKESNRQDKNYIALLGHIYQQTGQYALARQQYFRLLQAEPKNPTWLLGVSLALDAEGKKGAAVEGYQQLSREGKIDPKILEFVQERIKILK